jgi:trigger factor
VRDPAGRDRRRAGQVVGPRDLDALRKDVREQRAAEYAPVARARLKRALLDQLADNTISRVPPGMVDLEFETIWQQVEADAPRSAATRGCRQERGRS